MPDEKRQNAKIIRNGFRMLWSVKNSGVWKAQQRRSKVNTLIVDEVWELVPWHCHRLEGQLPMNSFMLAVIVMVKL